MQFRLAFFFQVSSNLLLQIPFFPFQEFC